MTGYWKTVWIIILGLFRFIGRLIATLIHYPCTVALTGLTEWSAFLEMVLPTMWSHDWDNGAHGGYQMGGTYGSDIHPVLVTRLVGPPGLSGLMTSTFWTHGTSKWSHSGAALAVQLVRFGPDHFLQMPFATNYIPTSQLATLLNSVALI